MSVLFLYGLFSGFLAGLLGIGGGSVLVPLLVGFGTTPVQAVATSSLAIVITSVAGSIQNWRMGYFDIKKVLYLGIPSIVTAQLGVYWADIMPDYLLLATFGLMLILNVVVANVPKQLNKEQVPTSHTNPVIARIITGGIAGLLAGLFGIGGGVIMVPLQMLFLGETIKGAIQTSLGVIIITSLSSTLGHAVAGNVLWQEGMILGFGGLITVQLSTRFLPKLSDKVVRFCFYGLLSLLSVYIFWKAWESYQRTSLG